ncbi:MAG: hypothetical protein KGZ45_01965 [Clostridium sp.]|nr:hypothetical protein [Clostridium sp.]
MRKAVPLFLLAMLVLAGCSRAPQYKNAASHLGDPRTVQIISPERAPVSISNENDVRAIMEILNTVEVRRLSVEEEINLVLVQGITLDATELRFKDNRGNVFKALLLKDGSVLVVAGVIGGNEQRRDVLLSEPEQQALQNELQKYM